MSLIASTMFVACGGSSTNNAAQTDNASASNESAAPKSSAAGTVEVPVSVDAAAVKELDQKVDKSQFTLSYPSIFKPASEEAFGNDGVYLTDGTAGFQLMAANMYLPTKIKEEADNMKGMMTRQSFKFDEPTVTNNAYATKYIDNGRAVWKFGIANGNYLMNGEYAYPDDQAAKYEKYLGAMLQSMKLKQE